MDGYGEKGGPKKCGIKVDSGDRYGNEKRIDMVSYQQNQTV